MFGVVVIERVIVNSAFQILEFGVEVSAKFLFALMHQEPRAKSLSQESRGRFCASKSVVPTWT